MSDGTCKTCKWWGIDDNWSTYTVERDGGKACACDKMIYAATGRGVVLAPDELGVAQSEYWLAILTGPDFGCIHHEEQP